MRVQSLWMALFNGRCFQTSGRFSSCSLRSSTISACCPTSPPCRRTGVLHATGSHTQFDVSVTVCVCVYGSGPVFAESQWREKENSVSTLTAEAHGIGQKHMETLSRICRTHLRYGNTHPPSSLTQAPVLIHLWSVTQGQSLNKD